MVRVGSLALTTAVLAALYSLFPRTSPAGVVDGFLIEPLQTRFHRTAITSPESLTGIIALSGDINRFSEAGRLARLYPNLKVVLSGNTKDIPGVVARLGGGIESWRIVLETRSNNTYENAVYCAALIQPKPTERWLLVTGALHMTRAIGAFRKAGFDVEPWPVYSTTAPGALSGDAAMHEWIGLIFYWVLGRTSTLLPQHARSVS